MANGIWKIAAILLFAPSLVIAQDRMARPENGPQPVQRPGSGGQQIKPARPGGPQIQPPRPGGPQVQPPRPGRPQIQPPRPGGPQIKPPRPLPGHARPPQNGHRPGFHRPPHYRPNPYRYPHGYAYRRWHVGLILPSILFSSSYYFDDYHLFGLYSPPLYYRWIRYGPDLLLVNTRNGHVRDVHYGAFG